VIKVKALSIVFIVSLNILYGQIYEETVWKSKKCAVALRYVDALNVHLDVALPVLDSVGFQATVLYLEAFLALPLMVTCMVSFGNSKHESVKPLHSLLDVTLSKLALSAIVVVR
jgi:hypothetical protein